MTVMIDSNAEKFIVVAGNNMQEIFKHSSSKKEKIATRYNLQWRAILILEWNVLFMDSVKSDFKAWKALVGKV